MNTGTAPQTTEESKNKPVISRELGIHSSGAIKKFNFGWCVDQMYVNIGLWEGSQSTEKGVAFNLHSWLTFAEKFSLIDAAIEKVRNDKFAEEFHVHNDEGLFVKVCDQHRAVDLRHHLCSDEDGNMSPTTIGITLTFEEYEKLKELHHEMTDLYKANLVPCYYDHPTSEEFKECGWCNPEESQPVN